MMKYSGYVGAYRIRQLGRELAYAIRPYHINKLIEN